MSTIFEKWNKTVNVEGLKKDEQEAKENGLDFKEVPVGDYEVKINKMELKESKKGSPMLSVWFQIVAGEFQNSFIFYNQVLSSGFGLHNANETLRNLQSGLEVKFNDFVQYNDLILDIHETIDSKYEYALKYGENKKGFKTFEITDVFEV